MTYTKEKKQNDEIELYGLDTKDPKTQIYDCHHKFVMFIVKFDEAVKSGEIDDNFWKVEFRVMHVLMRKIILNVEPKSKESLLMLDATILFSTKREQYLEILKSR